MSSPKPVIVPPPDHVKISKTGRPFVDIGELIKGELDRMEISKRPEPARPPDNRTDGNANTNGNGNGNGKG